MQETSPPLTGRRPLSRGQCRPLLSAERLLLDHYAPRSAINVRFRDFVDARFNSYGFFPLNRASTNVPTRPGPTVPGGGSGQQTGRAHFLARWDPVGLAETSRRGGHFEIYVRVPPRGLRV